MYSPYRFGRRFSSQRFSIKLLFSYVTVVIIAIGIALGLTTGVLEDFMRKRTVETNDRLLTHFAVTVDSLVLGGVDELSLKILQDTRTNPVITHYLTDPLEGDVVDVLNVYRYLITTKSVSPLVYAAGIYFRKNDLLVSTELIRHTLFEPAELQADFMYHLDLADHVIREPGKAIWLFDPGYGLNPYMAPGPVAVIHLVRNIYTANSEEASEGAIIISVYEELLSRILSQTTMDDLGSIFVVDEFGTIISHQDKELIGTSISGEGYAEFVLEPHRTDSTALLIDGVSSVVTTRSSTVAPWTFVAVTPLARLSEATFYIRRVAAAVAGIALMLGIIISIVSARRISKPLENLVRFCRTLIKIPGQSDRNELRYIESTIVNLTETKHDYERKFQDHLPMLHLSFAFDLVTGAIECETSAKERMDIIELDFPDPLFTVLVFRFRFATDSGAGPKKPELRQAEFAKLALRRIAGELFAAASIRSIFCDRDSGFVCVLNHSHHDAGGLGLIAQMIESSERETSADIWCGAGETVSSLMEVSRSYRSALAATRERFLSPGRKLFTVVNDPQDEAEPPEELATYIRCLKCLDRDAAIERLDDLVSRLQDGTTRFDRAFCILSEAVSAFEALLVTRDPVPRSNGRVAAEGNLHDRLQRMTDIHEFREWMASLIDLLFAQQTETTSQRNLRLVENAKEFVRENVGNRLLSLEFTADALRVSASHLSRVFGRQTGVRFVDYVAERKMDRIRDLLINTDLKMDDIAESVGYATSQYLIGKFKRTFGCTPTEFRRRSASYKRDRVAIPRR